MFKSGLLLSILVIAATQVIGCAAESTPPKPKTYSSPPPMTINVNKHYTATIKTDKGDIVLELYPADAPVTVNNFVFLAREDFYNGCTFHRVIPGFMAQGGDPTGTGAGGPGYTIKDEFNKRPFVAGTMGMARTAAPNSGGSQFFICFAPAPFLDGKYTVFGQVTKGMDVLNKITPRDPAKNPSFKGDTINQIIITESD
jgi:peptidylprolyl isomerase